MNFLEVQRGASKTNWFDWSLVERHADLFRFTKMLIERRVLRDWEHEAQRISLGEWLAQARKSWHGVKLDRPDWGEDSHSFALEAYVPRQKAGFYVMFNAFWEPLEFEIPALPGGERWRRWIDTGLASPEDIVAWGSGPAVPPGRHRALDRSAVVLLRDGGPPT